MKFKLKHSSIWGILMLSVITNALGMSKPQEVAPLMPREIQLSDNILHFSVPENFSSDMPAADMIESVNLADKSIYTDDEKFTLIRRWWDIKTDGFLGKQYGSIMMSVYIREAAENTDKDLLTPLGFIGTLIDDFNAQYSTGEEKDSNGNVIAVYPNFYEAYSVVTFNQQNWISYSVEHPAQQLHDIYYAIPVTGRQYIVVSFSFAAENSMPLRQFIEEHGRKYMDAIMQSFHLEYANSSQLPDLVKQPVNLQKLIDEKFYKK